MGTKKKCAQGEVIVHSFEINRTSTILKKEKHKYSAPVESKKLKRGCFSLKKRWQKAGKHATGDETSLQYC